MALIPTSVDQQPAIDLLDPALFQQRREHQAFDVLRAERGLHFNPEPDGPGIYAVLRHGDAAVVTNDLSLFSSAQGTQIKNKRAEGHGAASLHNSDPPDHEGLRAIGVKAVRRDMIMDRLPKIQAMIASIIDETPRGQTFDFVDDVAVLIPMMVFADLLGVPPIDHMRMVKWANTMSNNQATDEVQTRAREDLFGYFRALTKARRADPRDDITSALVHGLVDGRPLSDEQLDAFFVLLVVAGNETTRNLISGTIEQLCLQQDDFARVRTDAALTKPLIEEGVRWVSPVMQMRRTLTRDVHLFDTDLKTNDKVVVYFTAANRDPAAFETPEKFVIDRAFNRHLGFGYGGHFCLGAHLARIEAKIFFDQINARFSKVEIAGLGERISSNWFAGLNHLSVKWS
jgi:cytochrome P450